MLIYSINVNGLRAFDEKNGGDFNSFCLNKLKADILCLQEIKGSSSSLSKYHTLQDYQTFSSFYDKGRHGVSTLVRKTLFCGKTEEIVPGRILKTYHGNFVIFNCYMPYYDESKNGDKTEIIKMYEILKESLSYENTILCGDFNAVYNMLDHYMFREELENLAKVEKWVQHDQIEIIDIKKVDDQLKNQINWDTANRDSINGNINDDNKINKDSINGDIKDDNKNINTNNINRDKINYKTNDNRINDRIKKYKQLEEHGMEYGIIYSDKVEKIKPSKTELPFYFFTVEELERYFFEVWQRSWMRDIISQFTDTFRLYNDSLAQYTCWNVIFNLRPANLGTRIDYILCSKDLKCLKSGIMPEIKGSDHCPVFSEFDISSYEDKEHNLVKKKNNLLSFFNTKKS